MTLDNNPTIADTTIVTIAESCSDDLWFSHYRSEMNRLSGVEGRAGTLAYTARRNGDMDTYKALRSVESAANVAHHRVNSALLSGGF